MELKLGYSNLLAQLIVLAFNEIDACHIYKTWTDSRRQQAVETGICSGDIGIKNDRLCRASYFLVRPKNQFYLAVHSSCYSFAILLDLSSCVVCLTKCGVFQKRWHKTKALFARLAFACLTWGVGSGC